jgi:uncharacterized protein (TIGR02246 family)
MTDIKALTARLARLEDERDIARLIATYGPVVDAGDADAAANLWAEDGVYDIDLMRMDGRDEVRAMVDSGAHQKMVAHGCSHFLGPAVVKVDGDTAAAVCESLVLVRDGDGVFECGDDILAGDRIPDARQVDRPRLDRPGSG